MFEVDRMTILSNRRCFSWKTWVVGIFALIAEKSLIDMVLSTRGKSTGVEDTVPQMFPDYSLLLKLRTWE